MRKNWTIPLLIIISLIALILRVYKLDQIPTSINWDEAANGVNAWAIANYGRDEWGNYFPITFKSFGDDKSPIHIYFTALSVKLLGLSEFSTRLPAALFGMMNVIVIFYLGKILFNQQIIGLIAAFFLAISPFNLQFSRFNHEANFALFFFMLGLVFFHKAINKKAFYLPSSILSFCISMISYHSPKVVVPPIIVLLSIVYFKELVKIKRYVFVSSLFLALFALIVFLNPSLLGLARAAQTDFSENVIKETKSYKQTGNEFLGRVELSWQRYLTYFSTKYLFISGDPIVRHSIQTVGEFYKVDAIFLLFGILFLLYKKDRSAIILSTWALLAPIPAAITGSVTEISHSARALFQMGSVHLIAACGFYFIIRIAKKPIIKYLLTILSISTILFFFWGYLKDYYGDYGKRSAIEWQYGMKQIVSYVKDHPEYEIVYMTNRRYQPYIFFLFYLKTPLPEFLTTALYNNSEDKIVNRISFFNKYVFEGWEPIESMPNPNTLYILTPSEYDGLRHKSSFNIKKIIHYPPGEEAFFIVSAK